MKVVVANVLQRSAMGVETFVLQILAVDETRAHFARPIVDMGIDALPQHVRDHLATLLMEAAMK